MKKSMMTLGLAALLLAGCGPSPSSTTTAVSSDGTTVTKTTTTTTPVTTTSPVLPAPTLTQVNLDRVQNDMSKADVEAIFGQPTSSSDQPIPIVGGTQTTFTYQAGNSAVTIIFKNDQVKAKSGTFNP
jgi:hypothetical protein